VRPRRALAALPRARQRGPSSLERLTESGYVTFDNVHKTTVGRRPRAIASLTPVSPWTDPCAVTLCWWPFWRWPSSASGPRRPSRVHDVAWNTDEPWLGPWDRVIRARVSSRDGVHRRDLDGPRIRCTREEHDLEQSVVSDNCPFGAAAQHHRCCAPSTADSSRHARRSRAERRNVTLTSRARGDDACRVTANANPGGRRTALN